MHGVLKSFKQNPSHKVCENLINFQKPQKLGKKCMKCMIKRWKRDHTYEKQEKTEERVGKMKKSEVFGRGRDTFLSREIGEK